MAFASDVPLNEVYRIVNLNRCAPHVLMTGLIQPTHIQ